MQTVLNKNKIEYVLFHLEQHLDGLENLKPFFTFVKDRSSLSKRSAVVFLLSDKKPQIENPFLIKGIPVLFPLSGKKDACELNGDTLVFNHDLLKSAFYLLSGYQEQTSDDADLMQRFPYEKSVQKKLGVVTKPLVNYYFDLIIEGLLIFAEKHRLKVSRKRLFNNFGFFLSHDIDKIDFYHWRETAYRWLQILGLRKAHYDKKRLFKAAVDSILPTLFPSGNDPYRCFEWMCQEEKKAGIVSTFYFLNRDGSPHDARYFFSEKRIKDLMEYIHRNGCETGLHGSIKTADNEKAMLTAVAELKKNYPYQIKGIRQHFLKIACPETFNIQIKAGFKYDTTLGFAEHEGFRNSYCHPFRPYDIKEDKMMEIWEFPLNVMDVTLFHYRKLDFENAEKSVLDIVKEVKNFGGVFSMLWHNTMFDEYEIPGITVFYQELIKKIMAEGAESLTGEMLLNRLNETI